MTEYQREENTPLGRQIDYDHFVRVFNREMVIGVYPEMDFTYNGDRYQIRADLKEVYFLKKYEKEPKIITAGSSSTSIKLIDYSEELLLTCSSLEELVKQAVIDAKSLKTIWNQLDFILIDDDFEYRFCFNDWVYVKSLGQYGIVRKTPKETEMATVYGISLEGTDWLRDPLIMVKEEDLEYDERPEAIAEQREEYQDYLNRLSDC